MKTIYEPKEIKWGTQFLKRINLRLTFLVVIFFLWNKQQVLSQEMPNELWHPGYVLTNKGDSIYGNLKYDFTANLLQVAVSKNQLKAFSSQQILKFRINCQFFNRPRTIYSLPFNQNGNVNNLIFFEILVEGSITLMCREFVINEAITNYNSRYYRNNTNNGSFNNSRKLLTYDYYFLTSDGDILKFENKKKEILPFFKPFKKEIESYMKENRLRVDRQADLVRITIYYNQLVNR
jgi:hypothetical protein